MAIKKSVKPLPFNIIDQKAPWSGQNMLLYGSPGCGKTFLAGTAVSVPEMRDVLLLDNDGGSRTVRNKEKYAGIEILSMIGCSTTEYHDVFKWLSKDSKTPGTVVEGLKSLGDPARFKTIIVDNLGSLHWNTLQNVLTSIQRNRADDESLSQADYGTARSRMKNLMGLLAKFSEITGVTFIFTSHVEIDRTEYETVSKMRPALSGKLGFEIPGDLPIVGYIEVSSGRKKIGQASEAQKGGERVIHFDPSVNHKLEVKDQSELLGSSIVNPTMAKIYSRLNG